MNNFLAFQIHGAADSGGGIVGILTSLLTTLENLTASGSDCGFFATLMPGLAGMDNIHPLLVHFPIAFLSTFFVIDVIACLIKKSHWRDIASYFLYFGAVGAIFTVIAGFVAAYSIAHNEVVHEIMLSHQYLALSVLTLAVALSVWRFKSGAAIAGGVNHFFLTLSGLMCVLLLLTADLGSLMVYNYGTAVHAQPLDGCHHPSGA